MFNAAQAAQKIGNGMNRGYGSFTAAQAAQKDSRIAELAIADGRVVKSLEHLKDVTKIWPELIDQEGAA